jgi:membrane-bound ClpP family serine protease
MIDKEAFKVDILGFVSNIDILAAICFFVGFLLVIIEMFHPGFGAPGIIGGILLVLGIIFTARSIQDVIVMLFIIVVILGAALTVVLQSATKGRLSKTLVLSKAQNKEEGYIGVEDLNYFIGRDGIAATVLRPSGIADFAGVKLDVVTEGEFIEKGTKVKIIKVEGRRIVVRSEDTHEL